MPWILSCTDLPIPKAPKSWSNRPATLIVKLITFRITCFSDSIILCRQHETWIWQIKDLAVSIHATISCDSEANLIYTWSISMCNRSILCRSGSVTESPGSTYILSRDIRRVMEYKFQTVLIIYEWCAADVWAQS